MSRFIPFLAAALLAACSLPPADYNGAGAPRETAIVPVRSDRPVIALALGSGGARGFAHVGVIKALEEAGVEADIVTGASSGAIVAAFYASGYRARVIESIALEVDQSDLVDLNPVGKGWVKGEALQAFVNKMVGDRPIERMPRRFAVVATEAKSWRLTVFNQGNTGVAVRASASVPNVFVPPVINGEEYLDGGLLSPVPVKLARAMGADVVIAVDVSWFAQSRNLSGPGMSQYGRSGRYGLLTDELDAADVIVTPRTVRTRLLDFDRKTENILAGETAAREAIQEIRKRIAEVAARKVARR
jgi:NTE family protein